jgi:hypothetical protein|tara:strand:- start:6912 stop:7217 length:306 start_codon:yes stop_codon:yes gene_type:complete
MNLNEVYSELRETRGVKVIEHYSSPTLKHPSVYDRSLVNMIPHVWTTGDRYYKLASQYYGEASLWWIIAWYNTAPTEAHLSPGELIHIPTPLNRVYDMLGY